MSQRQDLNKVQQSVTFFDSSSAPLFVFFVGLSASRAKRHQQT